MRATNDGGPAYPVAPSWNPNGDMVEGGFPGMSLRDWFIGQALAGMCASSYWCENAQANDPVATKALADSSVAVADAILKAREQ